MINVYFENGKYARHEVVGGDIHQRDVYYIDGELNLFRDNFMLFGDIGIKQISMFDGSLDAKNAKIINNFLFADIQNSKAENINNADRIWLWDNSSLSNSSTNELEASRGNNTIDGVVSAKEVMFDAGTLNIAKNGILGVPDKNALDFNKISGEGKIYGQKQHAYYDTNNNLIGNEINIDLYTLNAGDGNEAFSFDGSKLVLNEGFEFNLSGDKPLFIVNNGVILKADISGANLMSISGSGDIKELHLSNNAHFGLNGDFEKAVIEKGSVLTLFKQVDFSKLSGEGFVNINGTIYDTSGHALNNANDMLEANILNYNFAVIKAVENKKAQIDTYLDGHEHEKYDVELLNTQMVNSDGLL